MVRCIVIVVLVLTFTLHIVNPKDPDEDKAYEFGFTIDGQQHRHEKKDVNGIIQGEFGFITADGIYHVTVYATDENGDFHILSMKNIRVSPPLDGSGGPVQTKTQQQSQQFQQPQPQQNAVNNQTPKPPRNIATQRTPFTTQPTIKPACAGCGYVTTRKPLPGEKFPSFNQNYQQNPQTNLDQNQQSIGNRFNSNEELQSNQEQDLNNVQNQPSKQENNNNLYEQNKVQNNQPQTVPQNQNVQNSPYQDSFSNPINTRQNNSVSNIQHAGQITNRNPEEVSGKQEKSSVTVSDNAIHVPGNPDIPIQDKYPGMVEGLPKGIEQQDIKDLLYKFNYTVGFHGHYEKGYKDGTKIGGYFVNGRDGYSRIVTYVADANGYRPKFKLIHLGLDSPDTPKEESEKTFGLKSFEFVWYPIN